MNNKIIEQFAALIYDTEERYKNSDNKNYRFKILSYRKVISIIKNLDFEIHNSEQIKDIKGIGKSTLTKIDEILTNGKLSGLALKKNDKIESKHEKTKKLMRITGIGPKKAMALLEENITLEDLLNIDIEKGNSPLLDKLTHHQKCGVKHFHDIERRIPYKEIKQIETYLKKLLVSIDPTLDLIICGSYRRRCKDSGDIDLILYRNTKKYKKSKIGLTEFLEKLKTDGFIVDDLTTINSKTKYMGFCLFDRYVRRIDIRMVDFDSLPCAMLYFTGSGDFNKNMRTFALKKNISLNEYGVYSIDRNKNKIGSHPMKSEKDIFEFLGLDYIEPCDRVPTFKFP